MPPRKKKTTADSVVVLTTSIGEDLIIRSAPTDAAVRGFVEEATHRYLAGLPAGPSGIPAYRIFTANRYETEIAYLHGVAPIAEIDIADLLPTP